MIDEKIINIEIEEILNPTFAFTKQLLEVNKIVFHEGCPLIARLDRDDEDDGTIIAYFKVENEDYFFAVYLDTVPEVKVRWVGMEAGNSVYIIVRSEVMTSEELIAIAGVTPNKKWNKGDFINKYRTHDDSGFIFEPNPEKADELENKIAKILKLIEPQKNNFINLAQVANVGLQLSYYGYQGQMWGWNITPDVLKKLAELNIWVDLDLYASGPELKE